MNHDFEARLVQNTKGFTIELSVELPVDVSSVWAHLINFSEWSSWASEIGSVVGEAKKNALLELKLNTTPKQKQQYRLLELREDESMQWQGGLFLPFVLKTVKFFELNQKDNGKTDLLIKEHYTGWMSKYALNRQQSLCQQMETFALDLKHSLPLSFSGVIRCRQNKNKANEPLDSYSYFLETTEASLFIKVFHRALSPLELELLKDKAVEVEAFVHEGNWDSDAQDVQSRTGTFLKLKNLRKL